MATVPTLPAAAAPPAAPTEPAAAAPTEPTEPAPTEGPPDFLVRGLLYFWYRLGHAHMRSVLAPDEDAARRAILARHPHARGQRLAISGWEG